MKSTKKNLRKVELLRVLKKFDSSELKLLLSLFNEEGINFICETISNVFFNARAKIKKKSRKNLCKTFKDCSKIIKRVSNKSISAEKRRKILNGKQVGSNLSMILNVALPLISSLLFGHS